MAFGNFLRPSLIRISKNWNRIRAVPGFSWVPFDRLFNIKNKVSDTDTDISYPTNTSAFLMYSVYEFNGIANEEVELADVAIALWYLNISFTIQ